MSTALKTTTLTCDAAGVRLDVFLSTAISGLTRSAAAKLLVSGLVLLDGIAVKKNHKTSPGETYIVTQNEPEAPAATAQDIWLDVVYEDTDVIVVNKPRGMVVHPAPGHPDGTLVNALLYHCGETLSGIGGVFRPGIVHRIDKDTSGLIIAAKNDRAHLSLTGQLASRKLTREYIAVVHGAISFDSGTINVPIGRHPNDRKKQAVARPGLAGRGGRWREAITHYEVLARYSRYTYVRCRLETGRTHQIRVHLAHLGHPILGDMVYGKKRKQPEFGITGQCLHALRLSFTHPSTGLRIELCSELPGYFSEVLRKLDNHNL